MISKDLIRILNKFNKKHPDSNVYFLTDTSEKDFITPERVVIAYASAQQIQQCKINPDDCVAEPKEGYEPIIVLG